MKFLPVINVPAGSARSPSKLLTFLEVRTLGYSVDIKREHMNGEPGWWFTVEHRGTLVTEGWCIGQGPRAKSQAMKDALEAITARVTLLSFVDGKVAS